MNSENVLLESSYKIKVKKTTLVHGEEKEQKDELQRRIQKVV